MQYVVLIISVLLIKYKFRIIYSGRLKLNALRIATTVHTGLRTAVAFSEKQSSIKEELRNFMGNKNVRGISVAPQLSCCDKKES